MDSEKGERVFGGVCDDGTSATGEVLAIVLEYKYHCGTMLVSKDDLNVLLISIPRSIWWRALIYYITFTLWDIRVYKIKVKTL